MDFSFLSKYSKGKSFNLLFHAFINFLSQPMKRVMVCNNVTIKPRGKREYFLKLAKQLENYEKYIFSA